MLNDRCWLLVNAERNANSIQLNQFFFEIDSVNCIQLWVQALVISGSMICILNQKFKTLAPNNFSDVRTLQTQSIHLVRLLSHTKFDHYSVITNGPSLLIMMKKKIKLAISKKFKLVYSVPSSYCPPILGSRNEIK